MNKHMMTTRLQSFGTVLLLMLFLSTHLIWATNQEVVRKKEYNQSFAVSPINKLLIDSKYGNITLSHWSKDEVAFRVVVEVKTRNERQAQEALERIDVSLKKEGNTVMGLTELRTSFGNFNGNYSINYYVSMPSWLNMELDQKYGNIQMPGINKGDCNITLKYGNLTAGDFVHQLNLDAKYSNLKIGGVKEAGNLVIAYGGEVKVGNARVLNISSKYSNIELGKVEVVNIDKKYGQLYIEDVESLNASAIRYSTVKIGKLGWNLACMGLDYSDIDVQEIYFSQRPINIEVEAKFGNLYVGLPEKAAFTVDARDIEYGDCDLSRSFRATKNEKHSDSEYYEVNGGGDGAIKFDGGGYGKLAVGVLN